MSKITLKKKLIFTIIFILSFISNNQKIHENFFSKINALIGKVYEVPKLSGNFIQDTIFTSDYLINLDWRINRI